MRRAAHTVTVRVLLATLAIAPAAWRARPARAAEVTRTVSALDDANRFDLSLTLSWLHDSKTAFVKRESREVPPRIDVIKDSRYTQRRDVLNLRADFGILWDVGLHVVAPLVLSDVRTLEFDQSASGCVFPGGTTTPTCVNDQNSTILQDGILPGYGTDSYGLDAEHNRPYPRPAGGQAPRPGLFRGPKRSGFESLGVGLTWAVFNQMRDDTKPTWTLGFDAMLDLFKDMRFDPANPTGNRAAGPGMHRFIWSTVISKRFAFLDPYFGAWYMLPVRTNGSIYQQYPGDNQGAVNPQQVGGVFLGTEVVAWENAPALQRVTVELRGHAEQHFFGRSASELWEPLSGSSLCRNNPDPANAPNCRDGLDEDLDGDGRRDAFPGVTETQAYGTFGGDLGMNVQVGRYIRFRGLFGLTLDMPHFLTYASAGVDRDKDGQVNSNLGTEANPTYRELIDLPGRRFKVEGTQIWSLFLEGSIMF